ncbi:MAG: hypothetical protein ACTSXG_00590 [Alphaproteobacteria bacterium]
MNDLGRKGKYLSIGGDPYTVGYGQMFWDKNYNPKDDTNTNTNTTTTTEKKFDFGKLLDLTNQVVDTLRVAFNRPGATQSTLPNQPPIEPEKPKVSNGVVIVVAGGLAIGGTLLALKLLKKL